MKNIKLSIIYIIFIGTLVYGGGEFVTVTPYETEDVQLATEAVVEEPIKEEVVVIIQPTPTPTPIPIPTTQPKVLKEKEINPSGFYAGLGITGVKYKTFCDCNNIEKIDKSIAMLGRVGYDFNRYIGIEARGMKNIANDEGTDLTHMGLFIKPMLPIGQLVNLYGLIGASKTSAGNSKTQKVNAEGLSLGGGIEIDLSTDKAKDGKYSRAFDGQGDQEKGIGLFIDYERLVVKENAPDLDTISAGVTYDF
jgi:OOP family OmpA-OmpF porin